MRPLSFDVRATQHFFKLWNEDGNPPFAAVVPSLLGFVEKICNDFIKLFTLKENANISCVKEVLLEPCLYYCKLYNTLNNILGLITSTWYMLFLEILWYLWYLSSFEWVDLQSWYNEGGSGATPFFLCMSLASTIFPQ